MYTEKQNQAAQAWTALGGERWIFHYDGEQKLCWEWSRDHHPASFPLRDFPETALESGAAMDAWFRLQVLAEAEAAYERVLAARRKSAARLRQAKALAKGLERIVK